MKAAVDSREQVLGRIRAATRNSGVTAKDAARGYDAIPRDYICRGQMTAEARLERMAERLREYDAEVVECRPEELPDAIRGQLAASGKRTFVVPEGLPAEWLVPGFDWKIDRNLAVSEVEQAEGVVTACFCGIAESGTIVLHHGATEGRRVISLLPDWHLCVVYASQIVETLPEYFDRCAISGQWSVVGDRRSEIRERRAGNEATREQGNERNGTEGPGTRDLKTANLPGLVTWISGPSATADIEMTRIKGVHGPRFLHVVLVRDEELENRE
jgi:L-lactate dehydrogenase complex protein LldG